MMKHLNLSAIEIQNGFFTCRQQEADTAVRLTHVEIRSGRDFGLGGEVLDHERRHASNWRKTIRQICGLVAGERRQHPNARLESGVPGANILFDRLVIDISWGFLFERHEMEFLIHVI